jgi:hypothetical protein
MSWIQTYTGNRFDFDLRDPSSICLEDVGHALGNLCRFTGHSSRFYSVAEHSVFVSYLLDPPWCMWGHLHDAPEIYINDLSSPLKRRNGLRGYRELELQIQASMAWRFDLPWPMPAAVKRADKIMVVTEAAQLLPKRNAWIDEPHFRGIEPLPIRLPCWSPEVAGKRWLERAEELGLS